MKARTRGTAGDFERRLARADGLEPAPGADGPLTLLRCVLRYQAARARQESVTAAAALACADTDRRREANRYPLLDLPAVARELIDETAAAVATLSSHADEIPPPLLEAGQQLSALPGPDMEQLVEAWLDDPSLVDPRVDFWVRTGAAPMLEQAAAAIDLPPRHLWSGSACPACGGSPQVSVIAEESGEFMAGSPRSLICSRCASSWAFPRATCVHCRLDDSRRLFAYCVEDQRWIRVDGCEQCRTYIKTFDLRQEGTRDVVPLVDDVASLVLDVWANSRDLHRPVPSFAGV